jgi:hypothetical protein
MHSMLLASHPGLDARTESLLVLLAGAGSAEALSLPGASSRASTTARPISEDIEHGSYRALL